MGSSLVIVIGLVVTESVGVCFSQAEWDEWKLKHNIRYKSAKDEAEHRLIWTKHRLVYLEHMRDENRTFDMEMNEFSDQMLSKNIIHLQTPFRKLKENLQQGKTSMSLALSNWDWRQHGAITLVKNLGPRGIDLSAASTECVESYHFIHNGTLPLLSAGEVYDCCIVHIAFNYVFGCINMIGGLCSSAGYPVSTGICNKSCTPIATVNGGRLSPAGDEDALKENVYRMPAVVTVDASHASFQLYKGGVYSDPACSQNRPTHAMQVVGYGTQGGQDYWICKNNFGPSWGMQGYILMARNKNNMCGIASNAIYPV